MKHKTIKIFLIASAASFIFLFALLFILNPRAKEETPNSVNTSSHTPTKTLEQEQKDVLVAASELLNDSQISPTLISLEERLQLLDSGDISVVDNSFTSDIRFNHFFEGNEDIQVTTYQAVITMGSIIKDQQTDNILIEPISDSSYAEVFLDMEAGQAFVPVSLFTGTDTYFSLEFVYVNGEWLFSPYSFLEAVKMSSIVNSD